MLLSSSVRTGSALTVINVAVFHSQDRFWCDCYQCCFLSQSGQALVWLFSVLLSFSVRTDSGLTFLRGAFSASQDRLWIDCCNAAVSALWYRLRFESSVISQDHQFTHCWFLSTCCGGKATHTAKALHVWFPVRPASLFSAVLWCNIEDEQPNSLKRRSIKDYFGHSCKLTGVVR